MPPTCGKFKAVRRLSQSGLVSVWTAAPSGEQDDSRLVMKVREVSPVDESFGDNADLDRFIDAARLQKAVADKSSPTPGAGRWVRVLEISRQEREASFVAERMPRSVARAVQADEPFPHAALRRLTLEVLAGLEELEGVAGRPHAQLTASNVFLGSERAVEGQRVALADPRPTASLSPEDSPRADVRALARVLVQCATGRLLAESEQLSHPVPSTEEWARLGAAGPAWLALVNAMLDPAPGELSTREVAQRVLAIKGGSAGGKKAALIAVPVVLALAAGGFFLLRGSGGGTGAAGNGGNGASGAGGGAAVETPPVDPGVWSEQDAARWKRFAQRWQWIEAWGRSPGPWSASEFGRAAVAFVGNLPMAGDFQVLYAFNAAEVPADAIAQARPDAGREAAARSALDQHSKRLDDIVALFAADPTVTQLAAARDALAQARPQSPALAVLSAGLPATGAGAGAGDALPTPEAAARAQALLKPAQEAALVLADLARVDAALTESVNAQPDALVARFGPWWRALADAVPAGEDPAQELDALTRNLRPLADRGARLQTLVASGGWRELDPADLAAQDWYRQALQAPPEGLDQAFEKLAVEVGSGLYARLGADDPRPGAQRLIESAAGAVARLRDLPEVELSPEGKRDRPADLEQFARDLDQARQALAPVLELPATRRHLDAIKAADDKARPLASAVESRVNERVSLWAVNVAEAIGKLNLAAGAPPAVAQRWEALRAAALRSAEALPAQGAGEQKQKIRDDAQAWFDALTGLSERAARIQPPQAEGRLSPALSALSQRLREGFVREALAAAPAQADAAAASTFSAALEASATAAAARVQEAAGVLTTLQRVGDAVRAALPVEGPLPGAEGVTLESAVRDVLRRDAEADSVLAELRAALPDFERSSEGAPLATARLLASVLDIPPENTARLQQLAASGGGDAQGVTLTAWRRLGASQAWATTPQQLEDEARLSAGPRALLAVEVARHVPEARRDAVLAELRQGSRARFLRAAQATAASEDAHRAVLAQRAEFFGADAAAWNELPAWVRFNALAAEVRAARSGADGAVRSRLQEALQALRAGPWDAPTQPRAAALIAAIDPLLSTQGPTFDPAAAGPARRGWQLTQRGENDAALTYSNAGVALTFRRVEVAGVASYVLDREVTVAVFAALAGPDANAVLPDPATLRGPVAWNRTPAGVTPAEAGERDALGWIRSGSNEWNEPIKQQFWGDFGVRAPSAATPMNHVTTLGAVLAAARAGCRLPTEAEWRAASGLQPGASPAPAPGERNLRDQTWARHFAHLSGPIDALGDLAVPAWTHQASLGAATNPTDPANTQALPGDDGAVLFWERDAQTGAMLDLVGNLAELVARSDGGAPSDRDALANADQTPTLESVRAWLEAREPRGVEYFGVIGGSATGVSPATSVSERNPNTRGTNIRGFSDVGFRLAFSAQGGKTLAQRVSDEVLPAAGFLTPAP